MTTKDKLNEKLITERNIRGLSQQGFAGILGISQSLLSQIESGKKIPSFHVAKKIALILNIPIGELFDKYK